MRKLCKNTLWKQHFRKITLEKYTLEKYAPKKFSANTGETFSANIPCFSSRGIYCSLHLCRANHLKKGVKSIFATQQLVRERWGHWCKNLVPPTQHAHCYPDGPHTTVAQRQPCLALGQANPKLYLPILYSSYQKCWRGTVGALATMHAGMQ